MDNEKRVLLAIVLSIIVLYIYQAYFAPPPPQRVPESAQPEYQPQKEIPPPEVKAPLSMTKTKIKSLPQSTDDFPATPGKKVSVSTDMFTAVFSANSARLQSFKLHRYKDKIESPAVAKFIKKIFSIDSGDEVSVEDQRFKEIIQLHQQPQDLPLRTSFTDSNGSIYSKTGWQPDKDNLVLGSFNPKDSLTFTQTDARGLVMQKKFLFSQKDYKIDFTFTLLNTSTDTLEGNAFIEWTAPYPSGNGGGFFRAGANNVPRFSYFIKDKVEKKDLQKIKDVITLEGDIFWTSMEEKYFTSAIVPKDQKPAQVRIGKTGEKVVAYQLLYPVISLKPGEEKAYPFYLYIGPKDIDILKQQGARLEKTIDFGIFDILSKPLLLSLKFFYKFLGNYGLAIILITVIIKIIFWPLTHKSFKSMQGMQKIQPEIAKLKEKYKNNKEEFARQQMGLYKKFKVNPLGGCLPMLLQIPVFIALYRVLGDSIELRHANFISFWINDLSAKDPTYVAPIVMGLSMLVQQKMTPTSADPTQAKMMMFMPIIFTVMFLNFPSGLVIYWLVNNVLSIAQQLYTNKKSKSHDAGGKECSPSKSKQKLSKKQSRKHVKN